MEWKSYLIPVSALLSAVVLPAVKAKAAATQTPYDDFGVALVEAGLPIMQDGKVEEKEIINAGLMVGVNLCNVLTYYANNTPNTIDNTAIAALRQAIIEIQGGFNV